MTLQKRLFVMSMAVALPTAALLVAVTEWRRSHDATLALHRVMNGLLTDVVRDACLADPVWFLAGPRTGRPSMADRQQVDADIKVPRPSAEPLPFEFFAYDDELLAASTAGPRLPTSFRDAFRSTPRPETVTGPYESESGPGLQVAHWTGWGGPCALLVVRMQARGGIWSERLWLYATFAAAIFAAAAIAFTPTVRRIRRLSLAAGASAKADFKAIAPDATKDEIGGMVFVFNDAAAEIHTRRTETADRIEALRRFNSAIDRDIAEPLAALTDGLAGLAGRGGAQAPAGAADVGRLLWQAHDVEARLRNLAAANHLRQHNDSLAVSAIDLTGLLRGVMRRHEPLALARGVTLRADVPDAALVAHVHESLTALAIGNLLDNAIRYNVAGGNVRIALEPKQAEIFELRIANDQPAIPDELFKGLTAIRRFRGDEGWNRRPNGPGLGLAVAREVADRSGLGLDLRRTASGGLEAVLIGGQTATRG